MNVDRENGDTLCQDAIAKEMTTSRVGFQVLDEDEQPLVGFTEIICHLIFDIKLDLTRKARYVVGGH